MSTGKQLAETLNIVLFAEEPEWFTSIAKAIEGLTAEQAAQAPAKGFNSIWAILNHIRISHEYFVPRLQGLPVDKKKIGLDQDWILPLDPKDEQAWKSTCERALQAGKELVELTAGYSDEELAQPYAEGKPSRLMAIQSTLTHDSYHAGEIVTLRHMLGLWLEKT